MVQNRPKTMSSQHTSGNHVWPLLFLAYINDMPKCYSSDIRLFADDSLLYRPIWSPEDNLAKQKDLDALENVGENMAHEFQRFQVLRLTQSSRQVQD